MVTFSTSRSRRRDVIPLASHGMVKSWSQLGSYYWAFFRRYLKFDGVESESLRPHWEYTWDLWEIPQICLTFKGDSHPPTLSSHEFDIRQPHWIFRRWLFAVLLPTFDRWNVQFVKLTQEGLMLGNAGPKIYDSCYLMPVLYHHFLRKALFSSVPIWLFSIFTARVLESWTQLCHQQLRTVVSVERSRNVRLFRIVRVPVGGFK